MALLGDRKIEALKNKNTQPSVEKPEERHKERPLHHFFCRHDRAHSTNTNSHFHSLTKQKKIVFPSQHGAQ
jgi:hypothetical protein